jgi:peptidase E
LNFLNITDLNGLSLTDIEVLPHYSRFIDKFENFEGKCVEYEKKNNVSVIRLNDGEGVIISNNEVKICIE